MLHDARTQMVFMHGEVDDLPLSIRAFRVLCHLYRRAGKKGVAWPGVQSVADHCFGRPDITGKTELASPDARRKAATLALRELEQAGLIKVEQVFQDGRQMTNRYILLNPQGQVVEQQPVKEKPAASPMTGELKEALVPMVHGTSNTKALSKGDWVQLAKLSKLLTELSVTPADLREWHEREWKRTWPGLQRDGSYQPPRPTQVQAGMVKWMERKPSSPASEGVVVSVIEGDME